MAATGSETSGHEQVHAQVRRLVEVLRRDGCLHEFQRAFAELEGILPPHFEAEESVGGFFDEILDAAPNLDRRAKGLINQHHTLLAQLAALKSTTEALLRDAAAFADLLAAHEAAENDLTCQAMFTDIGGRG